MSSAFLPETGLPAFFSNSFNWATVNDSKSPNEISSSSDTFVGSDSPLASDSPSEFSSSDGSDSTIGNSVSESSYSINWDSSDAAFSAAFISSRVGPSSTTTPSWIN